MEKSRRDVINAVGSVPVLATIPGFASAKNVGNNLPTKKQVRRRLRNQLQENDWKQKNENVFTKKIELGEAIQQSIKNVNGIQVKSTGKANRGRKEILWVNVNAISIPSRAERKRARKREEQLEENVQKKLERSLGDTNVVYNDQPANRGNRQ